MKKNRLLLIGLIAVLAIGMATLVVGCGSDEPEPEPETTAATT